VVEPGAEDGEAGEEVIALGIETSCDETSVALVRDDLTVLSNKIYVQPEHGRFGGVVPEIASREHSLKIEAVTAAALAEAHIQKEEIGLIAATNAPGLIGALLVGLSFAKGLAFSLKVPFVAVNHMDAHVRANFLEHRDLAPPFVALLVSGGHTLLLHYDGTRYELLGRTLDDAAGEALDKAGKMMGIEYPAGREIERISKSGNPAAFIFPRALPEKKNLNFSFSGLKTALRNTIKAMAPEEIKARKADILASYQEAVVDALSKKSALALRKTRCRKLLLAGGVACNGRLRDKLKLLLGRKNQLYFPSFEYCTDNGAMIAAAGLMKYKQHGADPLTTGASAVFNLTEVNYGL
jgi:N6-L-threonylcarbamoyladenine synthase